MALRKEHCVRALGFDAMYTMLEARGSREEHEARLFERASGFRVPAEILNPIILKYKRQIPRGGLPMPGYWGTVVNPRVIEELARNGHIDVRQLNGVSQIAQLWHELHYTETDEYLVREDMRELIARVQASGVTIVVTSNQDHRRLLRLLRDHDLLQFFDGSNGKTRVLSSEFMRHQKPSKRYIAAICDRLGLESSRQLGLIGNSLENDARAAGRGTPVCILDRSGGLSQAHTSAPGVTPAQNCEEIWKWVEFVCGFGVEVPPQLPIDDRDTDAGLATGDLNARGEVLPCAGARAKR